MPDFTSFFAEHARDLDCAGAAWPRPNPTFGNPAFEKARLKVLIVRLSPFRDVDRSFPHFFLADAVRRAAPSAYVDMCFMPTQRDRPVLRNAGIPFLVGAQSCRSADEFDLVLISNSFTLELVNVPYLLEHSGIPLWAGERNDDWPMFILGGSNSMASQSLIRGDRDCMVDAIFFGEGEHEVQALIRAIQAARGGKSRKLAHAAKAVDGLWVAGGAQATTVRSTLRTPSGSALPVRYPLLNGEEAGTVRLQVAYGCEAFCSFCFEGYDRKPYREVPVNELLDVAHKLKRQHGADTIELYGFNVGAHSGFPALLAGLGRLFLNVAFKSQRVDTLHASPGVIELELVSGKRSFTLGIEGISARQRARLNKSLTNEAIDGVIGELFRQKAREIKLFFLLVGDEAEADVAEFRAICRRIRMLRGRANAGTRIIASFGFLVRMPLTPMRYAPLLLDQAHWEGLWKQVRYVCEESGLECRLATPWSEYAFSQVMAMGGYWLNEPIVKLARDGLCFDGSLDSRWWERMKDWMKANHQWTASFLDEKAPNYGFALSFVKGRIPASFLHKQYLRSKADSDAGYCLGTTEHPGKCLGCNACADARQKRGLTHRQVSRGVPRAAIEDARKTASLKARIRPVNVIVRFPPQFAGVAPAWLNAFVFRRLISLLPDQSDNVISVKEQLFTVGDNMERFGIHGGETVLAIHAWDRDVLLKSLSEALSETGSDLAFLSVIEGFVPGIFRHASADITVRADSPGSAAGQLAAFARKANLSMGLRRDGATYKLEVHGNAAKRSHLIGGSYSEAGGVFMAHLEIGPKFHLRNLLASFQPSAASVEFSGLVA